MNCASCIDSEFVSEAEETGDAAGTDALDIVSVAVEEILAAEEECQRRSETVGCAEAEIAYGSEVFFRETVGDRQLAVSSIRCHECHTLHDTFTAHLK